MALLSDNMSFREANSTRLLMPAFHTLYDRYSEPWRAYHSHQHIIELVNHVRAAENDGVKVHDGAAALAFILWHDAIYDPQATHGRNETLSAQLCAKQFASTGQAVSVKRACAAILATIKHETPSFEESPDAPLLLDCDLAILGADPARFGVYDKHIRIEYAHVPEETYQTKRREVLAGFLDRDRIYLTDWAHERWDTQARKNLAAAIKASVSS